jgi:hypothetical protein
MVVVSKYIRFNTIKNIYQGYAPPVLPPPEESKG